MRKARLPRSFLIISSLAVKIGNPFPPSKSETEIGVHLQKSAAIGFHLNLPGEASCNQISEYLTGLGIGETGRTQAKRRFIEAVSEAERNIVGNN